MFIITILLLGSIMLPQMTIAIGFPENSLYSTDPISFEIYSNEDTDYIKDVIKETEVTGILTTFVIDGKMDSEGINNNADQYQIYIVDSTGAYHQLLLSNELMQQVNTLANLNGHKVTVNGMLVSLEGSTPSSAIYAQEIKPVDENGSLLKEDQTFNKDFTTRSHIPTQPDSPSTVKHVIGSQKFVTLLCKFGDSTDFTPQTPSYVETLIDKVDNYFEEVSYGNTDLDGSVVSGWYNMPDPRTSYINQGSGFAINIPKLMEDCTSAADDDIYFPDYDGINFFFNHNIFGLISVGIINAPLFLDGELKLYRSTIMSLFGWHNQATIAHEIGHSFGLPHSSGPYDTDYDSNWDIMSGTDPCNNPDEEYLCHGPHPISFYKYAIGWIDPSRTYVANSDQNQEIFIKYLTDSSSPGYLTALIPIGSSNTEYYSVESRNPVGYDQNEIPSQGVLIHKIDLSGGFVASTKVAQVVDGTFDFNPNDAGAVWTQGETFVDNNNNISVEVVEGTETGFGIVINPF